MHVDKAALGVAGFSSVASLVHLAVHGYSIDAYKLLIHRFNATYPHGVAFFSYANDGIYDLQSGLFFGFVTALLTFIGVFVIARFTFGQSERFGKMTRPTKGNIGMISIVTAILVIYALCGWLTNRLLLYNFQDVTYTVITASISGAASRLHAYFEPFDLTNIKEPYQIKILELDHYRIQQLVQQLMNGLIAVFVGLIVAPAFQTTLALPNEITGTSEFRSVLLAYSLAILFLMIGLFFGIWLRLYLRSQAIVDALRKYGTNPPAPDVNATAAASGSTALTKQNADASPYLQDAKKEKEKLDGAKDASGNVNP